MRPTFAQKLEHACERAGSTLCIGIDPDMERLPDAVLDEVEVHEAVMIFCGEIIAATSHLAAAYKFNFAFFEALGWRGMKVLEALVEAVPEGIITIADAKRGDIGNTARLYSEAIFELMGFDAATVSPYMGRDSVEPFLAHPGTCTFVLGRTSNPGSRDFQTLDCGRGPLYRLVAEAVREWDSDHPGTTGLVVGATDIPTLEELRELCPDTPFLIPGVGAQGGSPVDVARAAGSGPMLVNMSRSILYASGEADYAAAAAEAARDARAALSMHGA